MKKIFLFTSLSFFYFFTHSQTTSDKLDTYLQAAEKAGLINGSVLVIYKGIPLIDKGIGIKDKETNAGNTKETIYQIGSVTKQFTAAIIIKLVEQQKLQFSDKLSIYFPEFPNADKITIEHLLTHTSGIYNYTQDAEFMKGNDNPVDQQKIIKLFKDKPLGFEPGTAFNYSNSGYMMLGYIIEKITGKTYYQVVRELIFQPLQMTHTGFDFAHLKDANKATGYYTINGEYFAKAKFVDSSVSYAAGAIYSTTGDLYKWNQAFINGTLLKKTSLDNAFTPRYRNYGFGVNIDSINKMRRIAHAGGIDGFSSMNTAISGDSLVIIVLNNKSSANPGKVSADIQSVIYNQPYKFPEAISARKEIQLDPGTLNQYVGSYELTTAFHIIVKVENGKLMAQATGQPAFQLFAEKENFFFLKVVEAQVEFFKNTEGKVDKRILYQNGAKLTGVKKQ